MKNSRQSLFRLLVIAGLVGIIALPYEAAANHSWNGYHWARTSNPFTLKLGDNMSSTWDSVLATTASDWSVSTVLDTVVTTGQSNPKNCRPKAGRVEVCNNTYGKNGWLGVAQIWASGSHITQGAVRLNDTYFNTAAYNTTAWRNLVTCQEVGHTLGLDHQDENFSNPPLGTCMDYTRDPTPNQHPNQHDYDELVSLYSHLDATSTISAASALSAALGQSGDTPAEWGKPVRSSSNGRSIVFERDFGGGNRVFTFVVWAD